ncbi:MAG TPA: hypothetical protein DEB31_07975 [Clostridiales bacterium]|nr:hypothetical protein [Clostridiales bacterium]
MDNDLKQEQGAGLQEDCPIARSELCYWLSRKNGCDKCYIRTLKSVEMKEESRDRWAATLALLPNDVDDVHEAGECQFCKDEPRQADGYAMLEMAHAEPYFEKGMFFGFGKKVRTPVGSLLSLQFSCCARCRKVMRMVDVIQILSVLLGVVVATVLLMIPGFSQKMADLFVLLPVFFLLLMIAAGYFIGKFASAEYVKRRSKIVKLDVSEIPVIKKMLSRGWFFFQVSNNGLPRVSFAKRKAYDRLLRSRPAEREAEQPEGDLPLDNMNI